MHAGLSEITTEEMLEKSINTQQYKEKRSNNK